MPQMPKAKLEFVGELVCAAAMLFMLLPTFARDNGQWENTDPVISLWFRALKQPDNPQVCGEADAYWADGVEIKDGLVIAIITPGPMSRWGVRMFRLALALSFRPIK